VLEPAPAPEAPLGRQDPTRRHGLRTPSGDVRFAGLTGPEASAAMPILEAFHDSSRALVRIALPVLLTEGAGPHLLDADGRLTLAVGPHPADDAWLVAMGEPRDAQRIGVVAPIDPARLAWSWLAVAEIAEAERVAALDALVAATDRPGLEAWEREPTPAASG